MDPSPTSTASDPFIAAAVRLGLLDRSHVHSARQSLAEAGGDPGHAALRTGLLPPEAVDIVETILRPKEAVPGYEVTDLLGRGGMGVVYRARQLALDRDVALKTILISRMNSVGSAARFEHEARTVAQLVHPHIVQAYDFGRHSGRLYLAMEFVDGTNADALIRRLGSLSAGTVWGILRQAASGLAYAAGRGVVHRDIKPGNLLLFDPPEGFSLPAGCPMVKIADFGLARLVDPGNDQTRLTSENLVLGSPAFMAPEQFAGSDVDLRADIYSLGVTALQLFTGATPYDGLPLTQMVTRKTSDVSAVEAFAGAARLDPATRALLSRMTARDPAERPETYAVLISAIDQIISGQKQQSIEAVAEGTPRTVEFTRADTGAIVNAGVRPSSPAVTPANDKPLVRRPAAWRGGRTVALAVLIGLAVVSAGWWGFGPNYSSSVRRVPLQATQFSPAVFNGVNLSNWKTISGNWGVDKESPVVLGNSGSLSTRLVRRGGGGKPQTLPAWRLELLVQRRDAQAAGVEFGFAGQAAPATPRYAVRLTEGKAELVRRSSDTSPWVPAGSPMPIVTREEHAIEIERNPGGWFVAVDSTEIGSLPVDAKDEGAEVRLMVEGGPAGFSDITVTELRPVQ